MFRRKKTLVTVEDLRDTAAGKLSDALDALTKAQDAADAETVLRQREVENLREIVQIKEERIGVLGNLKNVVQEQRQAVATLLGL